MAYTSHLLWHYTRRTGSEGPCQLLQATGKSYNLMLSHVVCVFICSLWYCWLSWRYRGVYFVSFACFNSLPHSLRCTRLLAIASRWLLCECVCMLNDKIGGNVSYYDSNGSAMGYINSHQGGLNFPWNWCCVYSLSFQRATIYKRAEFGICSRGGI